MNNKFENPDTKALGGEESSIEYWKKQVPQYEPKEQNKRGNPSTIEKSATTFAECKKDTKWFLTQILNKYDSKE
jgi:hypothetical protein